MGQQAYELCGVCSKVGSPLVNKGETGSDVSEGREQENMSDLTCHVSLFVFLCNPALMPFLCTVTKFIKIIFGLSYYST